MTNPLHTLRDALGDLICNYEHQPAVEDRLTRAESALRELEAEPRYTVEAILDAIVAQGFGILHDPAYIAAIKRRLAERGGK